jgi:uncharacterized protein (UPF0333 family)
MRSGQQYQKGKKINKLAKAQSSLEYTVVVAVVVAALISMTAYIKRSAQGNYREQADQIGSAYDPKNTTSDVTISSIGNSSSNNVTTEDPVTHILATTTTSSTHNDMSKSGTETVGPLP